MMKAAPKVELYVPRILWEKMCMLGKGVDGRECGGHLQISRVNEAGYDGKSPLVLHIDDVTFPPQEATTGGVDFDEEWEINWMKEQGLWPGEDNFQTMPIWGRWHTHPGNLFWSPTDVQTMVANGIGRGILVNLELNPKEHKCIARVDIGARQDDWAPGVCLWGAVDVTVTIGSPYYTGLEEDVAALLPNNKARVREAAHYVHPYGEQGLFRWTTKNKRVYESDGDKEAKRLTGKADGVKDIVRDLKIKTVTPPKTLPPVEHHGALVTKEFAKMYKCEPAAFWSVKMHPNALEIRRATHGGVFSYYNPAVVRWWESRFRIDLQTTRPFGVTRVLRFREAGEI